MIEFIDSVMGSGKSTYAINYINSNPSKKIVVAAIILDEVDRYESACNLYQPKDVYSKIEDLKKALELNKSVAISHALLLNCNQKPDIISLIRDQGYELILDEVISDPIYPCETEINTLDTLESAGIISINAVNGQITWLASHTYQDRVSIRDACIEDIVYKVGGGFAIAHIKSDIFDAFHNVKILTYLAKFSLLYKYFEFLNIQTTIKTLLSGSILSGNPVYSGTTFSSLITIDNGVRRNNLPIALSSNGMNSMQKGKLETLRRHLGGFFQLHRTGSTQSERMWTTYKKYVGKLSGDQAKPLYDLSNFVQHTSKGTNIYQDVKILAYAIDKHMNPGIVQFLKNRNVGYPPKTKLVNSGLDMWALSEMLQWIWRSRIRKSNSIHIYIPSQRMRELLRLWLGQ